MLVLTSEQLYVINGRCDADRLTPASGQVRRGLPSITRLSRNWTRRSAISGEASLQKVSGRETVK